VPSHVDLNFHMLDFLYNFWETVCVHIISRDQDVIVNWMEVSMWCDEVPSHVDVNFDDGIWHQKARNNLCMWIHDEDVIVN
jgi:hypothetical protein